MVDRSRTRLFLFLAGGIVLLIAGFFIGKLLFQSNNHTQLYDRFEGLKTIRELHLVRHHYEGVIPITKYKKKEKKNESLEFLLVAPGEITGFMDLSKMKLVVGKDSLVKVTLPPPEISEARISLTGVKEYKLRGKPIVFDLNPTKGVYFKAFTQIAGAISKTRIEIRQNAIKNGIEEDTKARGEDYVRKVANAIGYRVEFVEPIDTTKIDARVRKQLDSALENYLNPDDEGIRDKRIKRVKRLLDLKN